MSSNEAFQDLSTAKEAITNSGNAIINDINSKWSLLSEGLKVIRTEALRQATNAYQNVQSTVNEVPNNIDVVKNEVMSSGNSLVDDLSNSWSVLSQRIKLAGAEAQKDATNAAQNLATEVKNKVYSPWMDEAFNRVNIILGRNYL